MTNLVICAFLLVLVACSQGQVYNPMCPPCHTNRVIKSPLVHYTTDCSIKACCRGKVCCPDPMDYCNPKCVPLAELSGAGYGDVHQTGPQRRNLCTPCDGPRDMYTCQIYDPTSICERSVGCGGYACSAPMVGGAPNY